MVITSLASIIAPYLAKRALNSSSPDAVRLEGMLGGLPINDYNRIDKVIFREGQMTRIQFLLSFTILSMGLVVVVACSRLSPSPTHTSQTTVAESLAQAFISAEEAEQAADYLGLFAYEAVFMDNGDPFFRKEGMEYMRNSQQYVIQLFQQKNFGVKFSSHFVSEDGRFIALTATYTNTGKDGNPASVPLEVILEVKDGKIIRVDDYYDSSPFY
jgi:ketosteroid isomerase-like protein